ncbi:inositol monophosphatase 1-like [Macrosteles quadrilineatus]|uniref:inositol monophosphatase 1-like n=1 Tax=Macrosteles quadrilineatus TaxID=74068 RepID=UPI0023E2AB9B|nr:inositol monophosphatase 1-like [Macrosteles quadrilineatus]
MAPAQQEDVIGNYYNVILQLVKNAGKVLVEGFNNTKNVKTKSADYDLVTEYDRRIEEILIKQLSANFPGHKFIGEETMGAEKLTDAPTWIIDPIDGTTNFVHRDANCAISVAFAVNRRLEIGIVYSPVRDQMFTAQRGKGAFLNGKPIHVSNVTDIKKSLVGQEISMAQCNTIKEKLLKRLSAVVSKAHGVRSIGTCAMSLCYVALGAWDAYQVDYLWPWDYSAGALIVEEAGGVVLSTDGSPFDVMKQSILVTGTKQLAEDLIKTFKQADSS